MGADIGSMIGVRQREMAAIENENMELKMIIYNLRKNMHGTEEARRLSGNSGYYVFEDDQQNSRRSSRLSDSDEQLRDSVKKLEEEVERLSNEATDKTHEANNIRKRLDDMRAEAVRARSRGDELEKRLDQALSEKMMLHADREVFKSTGKHAEERANALEARLRSVEAERRVVVAGPTVAEQVAKERKRVEDADRRVERMREAVSLLQTDMVRIEKRVVEARSLAAARSARIETLSAELKAERIMRTEVETNLRVAVDKLAEERKLADIKNEASVHKCDSHAGRGPCIDSFRLPPIEELEKLIGSMNIKHDYVDLSHDNLSNWRDTVLMEINDGLRLLYCFQRQVEQQRDTFVKEYATRISIESIAEERTTNENYEDYESTVTVESMAFTGRDTTTNRMASRSAKKTATEAA